MTKDVSVKDERLLEEEKERTGGESKQERFETKTFTEWLL